MTISSNLYAEKILAEHPIALWTLDDDADYISLADAQDRDISFWQTTGVVEQFSLDFPLAPIEGESIFKAYAVQNTGPTSFELQSSIFGVITEESDRLALVGKPVTAGIYAYVSGTEIESIEISLSNTTQTYPYTKFDVVARNKWVLLMDTFTYFDSGMNDLGFRVKVNYSDAQDVQNNYVLLSSMSVGRESENYAAFSLGKAASPEGVPAFNLKGYPAQSYGSSSSNGFYLAKDSLFYAKNSGVPIAYGSSKSVVLREIPEAPSFMFPGFGMLHAYGRNKALTLELWARISSGTVEPRKIIGSIGSPDGIYVDGGNIILKVGQTYGSHFVGEWSRPMLISLYYENGTVGLMVNGEQVIEIIDADTSQFNSQAQFDFIGISAYEDVTPVEIDVIAIYPYRVSQTLAKRRFGYGQALEQPVKFKGASLENSMVVDFSNAKYTKSFSYPRSASWNQASLDNVESNNLSLFVPEYAQPEVRLTGKSKEDLILDCSIAQSQNETPYFTFRPNANWLEVYGHLYFNNLNFLSNGTRGIYGVFNSDNVNLKQTLFYIENSITKEYLKVFIENGRINYSLNDDSNVVHSVILDTSIVSEFLAGLDLDKLAETLGNRVLSFLGNKNQLSVTVGSSPDFSDQYIGKIYSINFCNPKNMLLLSQTIDSFGAISQLISSEDGEGYNAGDFSQSSWALVLDAGSASTTEWDELVDGGTPYDGSIPSVFTHVGSYSLRPGTYLGIYDLRIESLSHWEDYIPLTSFAKYVTNIDGNRQYSLDMMQFNITYPEGISSNGEFRSYVSFQPLASGANRSYSEFTIIEPLSSSGVVSPSGDWINTMYQVENGTVVFPPNNIDINDFAIVVHLEFDINDIRKNIYIKKLQISSLSLSSGTATRLGTKYGSSIVPYTKFGPYFDYKARNAFRIYDKTSPYLYLTSDSGLRVVGGQDSHISRGISFVINPSRAEDFRLSAIQMFVRYPESEFPASPAEIFEIQTATSYTKFYLHALKGDSSRGVIFALDARTGLPIANMTMYLNGGLVKNPILDPKQWAAIGISYTTSQSLAATTGAIRVTGNATVNNINVYQVSEADEASRFFYRLWGEVIEESTYDLVSNPIANPGWEYWSSGLWQNVLVKSDSGGFGVDPEVVYKTFSGSNRTIVNDQSSISAQRYNIRFYENFSWQSQTLPAL